MKSMVRSLARYIPTERKGIEGMNGKRTAPKRRAKSVQRVSKRDGIERAMLEAAVVRLMPVLSPDVRCDTDDDLWPGRLRDAMLSALEEMARLRPEGGRIWIDEETVLWSAIICVMYAPEDAAEWHPRSILGYKLAQTVELLRRIRHIGHQIHELQFADGYAGILVPLDTLQGVVTFLKSGNTKVERHTVVTTDKALDALGA